MTATEMATVGITSSTPKSSILPSGTPSRPASASAPTPGTVRTIPHSRPIAMAAAMRAVPFFPIFFARLRASGADARGSIRELIESPLGAGLAIDGPDQRQAVHEAGLEGQVLTNADARHPGGDRPERAAHLARGVGLRVPGVEVTGSAGQPAVDRAAPGDRSENPW